MDGDRGPEAALSSLTVRGLEKRFGRVRANDGITAEFRPGEVHGLLGENGAGKSTMVKILAGIHRADAGTILLGDGELRIDSPTVARAEGIEVVHQHSTLIPALTVLENVNLIDGGLGRIDRSLGDEIVRTATSLGFQVDPGARVERLSVGARQRVEIARALMREARFLILDEPTSVLAPAERDQLFAVLRHVANAGTGVILVTHRLDEALEQCDRLTVLRHGRVVAESAHPRELTESQLIHMLVGELQQFSREPRPSGDVLVEAVDVSGAPAHGRHLHEVSLTVHAGEILGIAGVEGNGQPELVAALVGSWKPDTGSVRFAGRPIAEYPPRERMALVGDVPEDETLGLIYTMSVWENLALSELAWDDPPTPRARGRYRAEAARLVDEFDIKTTSVDAQVGQLSGGNRRRVLLARELSKEPRLVVASYATKGLDVRSADQVKRWIVRLAERGAAVVYIAAELDDLLEIADRIAVLAGGRVTGVMTVQEATAERLGQLMLSRSTAADRERVA